MKKYLLKKLLCLAVLLAGCGTPEPEPSEPAGRGFLPREVDEAATLIAKYAVRRDELRNYIAEMERIGRIEDARRYAKLEEKEAEKIKLLLEKLTQRRFDPAIEELGLYGIEYGGG